MLISFEYLYACLFNIWMLRSSTSTVLLTLPSNDKIIEVKRKRKSSFKCNCESFTNIAVSYLFVTFIHYIAKQIQTDMYVSRVASASILICYNTVISEGNKIQKNSIH